jgi:demethylmenaquinone methyltransferase/2-methoxy-6-polyprenyl-1,4-benzoquinol methylase
VTDYFSATLKSSKSAVVKAMFDEVAPKYDQFNAVLSLGLDTIWRRRAIHHLLKDLPQKKGLVLDMGCGSADLAGDLMEIPHPVMGADYCLGMLKEAQNKFPTLGISQSDATNLPFKDASISGLISAFVIRNIDGLSQGFDEFYRCLTPGGKVVILEFSLPKNPIVRLGFLGYLKVMFPVACKLMKGDGEAYAYLRKSIMDFGTHIDVQKLLGESGFKSVKGTPLLMGGVTMYEAVR